MPKVSILIPTYNCRQFIREAIESVLLQTFQDFEILIIDDGSTDGTREVVMPFVKQFPDKIHYIYQENKGLPGARNTGWRKAEGEYIALLDADDKWCPHRLEEGLNIIEKDKAIGLVHANITRISETGEIVDTLKRDARFLSGAIFEHIFLRRADISCPTVLFRKECCQKIGFFDENLRHLGCEDRELWLRIAKEYKIVYLDRVLAYYRLSAGSMSHNAERMLTARHYVVDKFCPAGQNENLRKKALAKIYRDLGDEFLCSQRYEEARRQYQKSLSFDFVSFWPWLNLLKAILKLKV